MPSPCPHLHLHSTHSPSFFSKHPCDLSFSWSFMIREIFLYLSEMWFSQLFSQVWQLWLTPFLITSVRDKKSMYRGRCRLAPRQTNEAMFFCFFFSKCRWCYRSKVGNTPTITNPPKKMIYIYMFSVETNGTVWGHLTIGVDTQFEDRKLHSGKGRESRLSTSLRCTMLHHVSLSGLLGWNGRKRQGGNKSCGGMDRCSNSFTHLDVHGKHI